jgi:hypothetical protein
MLQTHPPGLQRKRPISANSQLFLESADVGRFWAASSGGGSRSPDDCCCAGNPHGARRVTLALTRSTDRVAAGVRKLDDQEPVCGAWLEYGRVSDEAILGSTALALVVAITAIPAEAKGCIKGAIVGGTVGHFAGHHGLMGGPLDAQLAITRPRKTRRRRNRINHCVVVVPAAPTELAPRIEHVRRLE